MFPVFDGYDDARLLTEADELRLTHGLSWSAQACAFFIDGVWQVWWKDVDNQTWMHRRSHRDVVQIPLSVV